MRCQHHSITFTVFIYFLKGVRRFHCVFISYVCHYCSKSCVSTTLFNSHNDPRRVVAVISACEGEHGGASRAHLLARGQKWQHRIWCQVSLPAKPSFIVPHMWKIQIIQLLLDMFFYFLQQLKQELTRLGKMFLLCNSNYNLITID